MSLNESEVICDRCDADDMHELEHPLLQTWYQHEASCDVTDLANLFEQRKHVNSRIIALQQFQQTNPINKQDIQTALDLVWSDFASFCQRGNVNPLTQAFMPSRWCDRHSHLTQHHVVKCWYHQQLLEVLCDQLTTIDRQIKDLLPPYID